MSVLPFPALNPNTILTVDSTAYVSTVVSTDFLANITMEANHVMVGKVNLTETLQKMQQRLAILESPDPGKLAKYAVLRDAYDKYKMYEALCNDE